VDYVRVPEHGISERLILLVPDLIQRLSVADRNAVSVKHIATALARAHFTPVADRDPDVGDQRAYFTAALALLGIKHRGDSSLPPPTVSASFELDAAAGTPLLRSDPVYLRADVSR